MWISIVGLIFSIIAVFISFFAYLFNKKQEQKSRFEKFIEIFFMSFNKFLSFSTLTKMICFKYDFGNNVLTKIDFKKI